jgi:hypothetical protein
MPGISGYDHNETIRCARTITLSEKKITTGDKGLELPDDEAARRHAQALARDLRGLREPLATRLKNLLVRARRSDGREVARVRVGEDKPEEPEQ